ncbi:MAG: glycoside hydrolase family 25 [Lachnospiraceae bacterium]|jgi:GH25 family lysozyme M1 (1,4-beta-N-acetylmuramidase)|nr:glycoside hydrolase family 25 [Lachnospiraceae bacterium]
MKLREDDDLEFVDLDDEEYDLPEETADDEDELFDEELDERTLRFVHRVLFPSVIGIVAVVVVVAAVFLFRGRGESEDKAVPAAAELSDSREEDGTEAVPEKEQEIPDASRQAAEDADAPKGQGAADAASGETEQEEQDPETETMSTEQGTEVDVSQLLSSEAVAETDEITFGIDVARYQGTIDWAQVAASGVEFAMVRVGYRMDKSREIVADSNARYNMQEAQKNGIKLGAYFFSTAVNEEEAKAEADWTADYISQYQITYPVAFDCEGFEREDSAQYGLSASQRTDIAIAFLNRIYERGYTPMFYSSMHEMTGDAKWETSRIEKNYRIWVSQYPSAPYPQTEKSSYQGVHAMWQYTNRGTVAGISQPVDVNIAYFGYEGAASAQSAETPEEASADVEALMPFTVVDEEVTAKDTTNLRSIPSQGEESTVLYTLKNGDTAKRTGVSDSGWSRLTYNGQTVYAVSSYLTTDLSAQAPKQENQEGAGSGDGLKTKFSERNEQVTAKIEVNLRRLPSVTNPDAAVAAVLHNGEYATRTGINEEYGWSRVEYNGETLYCISSYLREGNE